MKQQRDNRKALGNYGEHLVKKAYLYHGYLLLAEQFRCPFGEIDLIFQDQSTVIFVEVRTKTSLRFGTAEESITKSKQERIRRVSKYFLQQHHLVHIPVQFDVVTVMINKHEKKACFNRVEHAF